MVNKGLSHIFINKGSEENRMKKRDVILDVDPGHDDAIAILVASKLEELNILGLSVVSGNSSIELTVKNTLNICDKLSLDYPVYQGMTIPMVRDRYLSSDSLGDVHGESGLDGPVFREHNLEIKAKHAVNFICETIMSNDEPVTIVASGPLSNVGMALRLYPEIKDNIEEIVLMGGSATSGNVTPAAEFNILADPEAAHIVFSSGLPIVMMGLDVTRQALAYQNRVDDIKALNNVGSEFFCDLVEFFAQAQKATFGWEAPPIHDVCNIVYLANPDVFDFNECQVDIDINRGINYGRTVCDVNHIYERKNTKVAMKLEADAFWKVITDAIAKY
mgnify:CR=1 FL=1